MSNKAPSKQDVRFILAEDIRPEIMGKLSVQGFIPGETFFVGGKPPPELGPNVAFAVPSLTFLFVITGGEGKFDGRFRVIGPDKKTMVVDTPAEKPIEKIKGKAALFATASKPFVGPAFGTYAVELELGSSKFRFSMTVQKGPKNLPAK